MSDPYGQITITDAEYRNLLACREERDGMRITDEERYLLRWMLAEIMDKKLGKNAPLHWCDAEVFVPLQPNAIPLKRAVLDMIDRLDAPKEENETLQLCKLQARIDETKTVTEEWAETLAQTTVEREKLKLEVERLTAEVAKLRPHSIVKEALDIAVTLARCEIANFPSATKRGFWQEYADTVQVLLKRLEGGK